jgi:uncharacterized surface protein with fasciclin (FAS1) repeats
MKRIAILNASLGATIALLMAGSVAAIAGEPYGQDTHQEESMQPDQAGQQGHDMQQAEEQMEQAKQQKHIAEGISNSADHTTLAKALKTTGLHETLMGSEPYTVFAPTDAAFKAMPNGNANELMQPENKDQLRQVIVYHVIQGRVDAKALVAAIKASGGSATLTTVQGNQMTARTDSAGDILLIDATGATARVTSPDLYHKNGVVHVIDAVLTPE